MTMGSWSNSESARKFRAFGVTGTSLGNNQVLVRSKATGASKIYPANVAQLLFSRESFKTLQEYGVEQARRNRANLIHGEASSWREKLFAALLRFAENNDIEVPLQDGERSLVVEQMRRFIEGGFLISEEDLRSQLKRACNFSSGDKRSDSITVIGIPTCNRPQLLNRALISYVKNTKKYDRPTEFVIVDDSREGKIEEENRTVIDRINQQYEAKIHYIDRQQRRGLAQQIADRTDVPLEIAEFGLVGDQMGLMTYGAAVNTLLIQTAGEMIFLSDDDMICRSALSPESNSGLALSSKPLYEYWFFEDRTSATEYATFTQENVLGKHENLLGQNVSKYLSEQLTDPGESLILEDLGFTFLKHLEFYDPTIVITFPGLAGESGSNNNLYRLSRQNDSTYERLVNGSLNYRTALQTRQIIKTVKQTTIGNDRYCMSGAMGMDNRRLVPPFMPVARNCDGTFSYVLHTCFRNAYRGHLPHLLVHDPVKSRFQQRTVAETIQGPRINDTLQWLIFSFHSHIGQKDGWENMKSLGHYLRGLSSSSMPIFEEHVREICTKQISQRVREAVNRLDTNTTAPRAWQEDVREYIIAYKRGLEKKEFFAPADLNGAYEHRMVSFQKLVNKYGRLLLHWRDMVETAKELEM